MNERIKYIDRLKGFAILAVIIGHISIFSFHIDESPIAPIVSTFHMPIFMFLSGFVVSSIPVSKKMIGKVFQFIMPMLCIGLLYCFSFGKTIQVFFFDNVKSGYWYLFTLSIFYFLVSIFRIPSLLTKNSKEKKAFLGFLVWAFGIWGIIIFLKFSLPILYVNLFSINQAFNLWPCFIFGFLLRRFNLEERIFNRDIIYTASLLGYIILVVIFVSGYYHIYTLVGFCSIPFLVQCFRKREKSNTWYEESLAYIGKNSLDVYIYHFFIIKLLFLSDFGSWVTKTENYFIEAIVSLFLSIIIAYLCILIGLLIKQSHILSQIVYGKFVQGFLTK